MLKRFFILLLAVLLVAVSIPVLAETQVRTVKAKDIQISKQTDVLIVKEEGSDYYKLTTVDGQDLTGAIYSSISAVYDYPMFKVSARSSVDGVHDEGLLDAQGKVIIPTEYADIAVFSDRWQAGVKLVPSNADDKDYTFTNYSTDEKTFHRIDTVDFFFDGQKVGTLKRSEYGENYAIAHGAYICVNNRSKEYVYYNSRMEKSPYKSNYSGEYDNQYKNGKNIYYHQGSGQVAFTEGCTLQPDEVDNPYLYDRGVLYGLQGQTIFKPAQNYDYIHDFVDGYAPVSMNRYYGVIDEQGNEVIPVEYDELSYNFPVKYGYIGAVKDGKFGFLDLHGNVTCDFTYSKEIVKDRGTFATITNLDGTTIVLSAVVGELPEHYAEVDIQGYNGCLAFVAENLNGEKGVVDIYGNTVVPFSEDNSYIYVNIDATVAVVSLGSHEYRIYQLDIPNPVEQAQAVNQTAPQEPAGAPAAEATEGWTCENGHSGNTGKFCTECGAPAPAQKSACAACGYEFEDGNVPKFCPNCGAAQQ